MGRRSVKVKRLLRCGVTYASFDKLRTTGILGIRARASAAPPFVLSAPPFVLSTPPVVLSTPPFVLSTPPFVVSLSNHDQAPPKPLAPTPSARQKPPVPRSATFSPLAHRAFLLILLGSLLSNFGNAIQSVGAAWQLTASGQPAAVIALVQTAINLPIMLLALAAGPRAD